MSSRWSARRGTSSALLRSDAWSPPFVHCCASSTSKALTSRSLVEAVPGMATWPRTVLPSTVTSEAAARLAGSCDTSTAIGRRDAAILSLLARLGLRAGEVAGLALDDIDWRAGELRITGKGGRVERLPLLADVGKRSLPISPTAEAGHRGPGWCSSRSSLPSGRSQRTWSPRSCTSHVTVPASLALVLIGYVTWWRPRPQMSGVAWDASFPGKREDGAIGDPRPGSPTTACSAWRETAGQHCRVRASLRQTPRCRISFCNAAWHVDASTATAKTHQGGRRLPSRRS